MDSYTKIVSSKFIVDSPMVLSSPLGYSTYFMNPDYDIRVRSDFEENLKI